MEFVLVSSILLSSGESTQFSSGKRWHTLTLLIIVSQLWMKDSIPHELLRPLLGAVRLAFTALHDPGLLS